MRLDAKGKIGGDLAHRAREVLAERENVAALAHRDRQTDGGLPVYAEHGLRRIGIGAADRRDVGQPYQPPVHHEIHIGDVLLGVEGA